MCVEFMARTDSLTGVHVTGYGFYYAMGFKGQLKSLHKRIIIILRYIINNPKAQQ